MLNQINRLSQKSYTMVQLHPETLFDEVRELVENAQIQSPKLSDELFVETLTREVDKALAFRLGQVLIGNFYVSLRRAARRRKAAEDRKLRSLPGCGHLPAKIPDEHGGKIALADAHYRQIRAYSWQLKTAATEAIRLQPKFRELTALLAKMQIRAASEKGITVRQVLLTDVRMPGERLPYRDD